MLKWAVRGPQLTSNDSFGRVDYNIDFQSTQGSTRDSFMTSSIKFLRENTLKSQEKYKGLTCRKNTSRKRLSCKKYENPFTTTPVIPTRSTLFHQKEHRSANFPIKCQKTIDVSPIETVKCDDHGQSCGFPKNYFSTLPTFDVEYSPCSSIPGSFLAMRGLRFIDTYFEKPRYLSEHGSTILKKRAKNIDSVFDNSSQRSFEISQKSSEDDFTMNDMIQAILQNDKENNKANQNKVKISTNIFRNKAYNTVPDYCWYSNIEEHWEDLEEYELFYRIMNSRIAHRKDCVMFHSKFLKNNQRKSTESRITQASELWKKLFRKYQLFGKTKTEISSENGENSPIFIHELLSCSSFSCWDLRKESNLTRRRLNFAN